LDGFTPEDRMTDKPEWFDEAVDLGTEAMHRQKVHGLKLNDMRSDERMEFYAGLAAVLPMIEEWVQTREAAVRRETAAAIAERIANLSRPNCGSRYDGSEDALSGAWVEGIDDAHDIAREYGEKGGEISVSRQWPQ